MTLRRLPLLSSFVIRKQNVYTTSIIYNQYTEVNSAPDADEECVGIAKPFSLINQTHKPFLEELQPPIKRSFNLAAYVNKSKTLQELVKLGVSLYDIENRNNKAARLYASLDFERDCVEHIKFLVQNGLKEKNLGRFISEFPMIFSEHLDDLQTRINYYEAKGFSKKLISQALNRSSKFLSNQTKTIDFQLGRLAIEFKLPPKCIREIIAKCPDLISVPATKFKLVNFTLAEEYGFELREIHRLLVAQPDLLDMDRFVLESRLDLVHNTIGLNHKTVVRFPKLLTGPILNIKHRYEYLSKLGRDQFDPLKPLYVCPSALYDVSDEEFCSKYAKTCLDDYKLFLKSC